MHKSEENILGAWPMHILRFVTGSERMKDAHKHKHTHILREKILYKEKKRIETPAMKEKMTKML